MAPQWFTSTVTEPVSETWGQFWSEFGVRFSYPMVALVGDRNTAGIKKVLLFNGNQMALVSIASPVPTRSVLRYLPDQDQVQIDGVEVGHAQASLWTRKMVYLIQESRVAWFYMVPRKASAVQRNPYWERVAESVGRTLKMPYPVDLMPAGKQGAKMVLGIQSGLLKLQSIFEMASAKEWDDLPVPPPSFSQLMKGSNVLHELDADRLIRGFFSSDMLAVLESDHVVWHGYRMHVDAMFDVVLEYESPSRFKQWMMALELWVMGMPVVQDNRETRQQRIWKRESERMGVMLAQLKQQADHIRQQLSMCQIEGFCQAIESQPFALIHGSNDALRQKVVSQLLGLDRAVQQLQSFFEWNHHVLPHALACAARLAGTKELLSRWIKRAAESVGELGELVDEIKCRRDVATKRLQHIQSVVHQLISVNRLNAIVSQLDAITLE